MASTLNKYDAEPVTMYPEQGSPSAEYDVEKAKEHTEGTSRTTPVPFEEAAKEKTGPLWTIANKLSKYGVEERGIERVYPHERNQKSAWGCFWMWLAANCTTSTFALGTLGAEIWYLGFRDAALTIIFFNLIGTIPVATFSTWGPKTGLRQLALSRFGFGYFTVIIPVLLNCLACIGWSTLNSIVGAQCLQAVSLNGSTPDIPTAAAIVVIAIGTVVVSFLGYKFVHIYEKYSWIPVAIIFIIYAGVIGKAATQGEWGGSGAVEAASVLSFGATIVGFALGWSSLAADYSCHLPEDTPAWKVWWLTYAGLNIPTILLEILGAAAMTTFTAKPTWADAYDSHSTGGLLAAPMIDRMGGFGRFLMVILALSIIANNIPNIYSFALTFQVLGPWAQAIPRPFIVLVATGIYIVLAIVGANHFYDTFETLLNFLSYWLAIYSTIMLEEHFIFRKGNFANWNYEDINTPSKLPLGVAAFFALGIGWIGPAIGMSTTWYVGKLARHIGDPEYGADIGFELGAAFAGITYPLFRYIEKKYWKY